MNDTSFTRSKDKGNKKPLHVCNGLVFFSQLRREGKA
jgi:hypothetical protein